MKKLTTKEWIAVAVVLIVIGLLFSFGNIFSLFNQESQGPMNSNNQSNPQLIIEDKVVGTGAEAKQGSLVSVHYVGTFTDGTKFDSSVDRGQPFQFRVGIDGVIEGWQRGLVGMKVGGKRKLVIPPELGYGPNDYYTIPGGSTLIFEIELLDVK